MLHCRHACPFSLVARLLWACHPFAKPSAAAAGHQAPGVPRHRLALRSGPEGQVAQPAAHCRAAACTGAPAAPHVPCIFPGVAMAPMLTQPHSCGSAESPRVVRGTCLLAASVSEPRSMTSSSSEQVSGLAWGPDQHIPVTMPGRPIICISSSAGGGAGGQEAGGAVDGDPGARAGADAGGAAARRCWRGPRRRLLPLARPRPQKLTCRV